MRKITKDAIGAFLEGRKYSGNNTIVTANASGIVIMYLFGDEIARKNWSGDNEIEITNAGWFTDTTKERLNGFPSVCISQSKGKWYLNGSEWDGKWTKL